MTGFQPGELIYLSKPYAYILAEEAKGQRCDHCFKKCDGLKRCSQCSYLYFCDRNCQKEAWEIHKIECKLMKEASPLLLPKSLLLLSRILFKIQKFGVHEPVEEIWGHKMNFSRLVSHAEEISDEMITTAYELMTSYFRGHDVPSVSTLREMIGKIKVNTFSILDEEMRSIGGGLYLGGSIFDHSCEPNAEIVFNGLDLLIRAVKEIPHRDVTRIYISYIDQLQLREDRQNYLNNHYYFTCQCPRCTTPYYENLLTKTLVGETHCASMLSQFQEKVAYIKQMIKNKAKPTAVYNACMDELQKQENILGDTHLFRIKILEFAFDACIDKNQWTEAAIIGKQLTEPYKLLYGKYHPCLGIHYFKVGKIQNVLGHFESAKENLFEAHDVLKVTHGVDHPLFKDLLDTYQDTCIVVTEE